MSPSASKKRAMKVTFLGTSSGWPHPRLSCFCEMCTSQDARDTRKRSQLLINQDLLIDAGPDTYQTLLSRDISSLQFLCITHAHPDHTLGLNDLREMSRFRRKLTVFIPLEVLNSIKIGLPNVPLDAFHLEIIQPLQPFRVQDYQITYFPVHHTRTPAFGIKVKERKLIAYIPDMASLPGESTKAVRDLHLLIMDASIIKRLAFGHQSLEEGVLLGKKLHAKRTYFTHIGHATLPHEKLESYVHSLGGPSFHIAYDNLELTLVW
ncbi:MAG TPA: MBL fold metallo-hydrolase [Patescibacteria group bacterium]|nr:MBL fold metallo-hydrolase [Patescibacteria group bacterium]